MYLFGLFVGSVCGFAIMLSASLYEKRSAVNAGWIELDGVPYTINKSSWLDIVKLKKDSGSGD